MTRRLPFALALSVFVALPSTTAFAGPAPLHPAPSADKSAPGALAKKKRKSDPKAPVVTRITPRDAKVGDVLTVSGKNFVRGKGKNQVAFYTLKGGAAFARDESASSKRLKVRVPSKLNGLLPANGEQARIVLRIRGKRLGKRSATNISPLIAIGDGPGGNGPGGGAGCTPQFANPASDVDQDLISDARERDLKMDACNRDSDGDSVSDGYEHYSALDLNQRPQHYPEKRPYPNALFKDAEVDYDGDGLTLWDEYSLWTKFGGSALPLNYSDGKQTTIAEPAPAEAHKRSLDANENGVLSDDERDADNDSLGNWDESHGHMTSGWWVAYYDGSNGPLETPYPVTFGDPDMLEPDTDGDKLEDGLDDNDFDGLPNWFEVDRPDDWPITYVSTGPGLNRHNWDGVAVVDPTIPPGFSARYYSRTQPFNPCKPVYSKVCHLHPPFGHYPVTEDWVGHRSPPARGQFPEDV